jgi:hypothetical protein
MASVNGTMLAEAVDALSAPPPSCWTLRQHAQRCAVGATPYLRLLRTRGRHGTGRGAAACLSLAGNSDPALLARIATARFFANIAVGAGGLARDVTPAPARCLQALPHCSNDAFFKRQDHTRRRGSL